MEISLPDLVKVNIQKLIDEICGLQKTKKELEDTYGNALAGKRTIETT